MPSFMRRAVFATVPSRLILFTLPTSTPAISTGDFVSRPAMFLKWARHRVPGPSVKRAELAYPERHVKEEDDARQGPRCRL